MWSRSQRSCCFLLFFHHPSSSCYSCSKVLDFLALGGKIKREELWCVDVEMFGFEGMARYFTTWSCVEMNVIKMSYKIVKARNQTCSVCWATCSCLNELDKILIQDATIELCFVLDVADVEESLGGHRGLCHQFLTARNLTKTLTKREECFCPATSTVLLSAGLPLLEICRHYRGYR